MKSHIEFHEAFLAGERIPGIKFRHNSSVAFVRADGARYLGSIVSVDPNGPEPIYRVDCGDGSGDEDVIESRLELIAEPPENPTDQT